MSWRIRDQHDGRLSRGGADYVLDPRSRDDVITTRALIGSLGRKSLNPSVSLESLNTLDVLTDADGRNYG